MKHGDISNRSAPIVAFSLENIVLRDANQGKFKVHIGNVNYINEAFGKKDCTIIFSTFLSEKKVRKVEEILDQNPGIMYNGIVRYDTLVELKEYIMFNDAVYFDIDEQVLEYIGWSHACRFNDEWKGV